MLKRAIRLYRYQLPIETGRVLKKASFAVREGFILECEENNGIGRGEIAPLPSFSQEGCDEALLQIKNFARRWVSGEKLDWEGLYPSVSFGFSLALSNLSTSDISCLAFQRSSVFIATLVDIFSPNASKQLASLTTKVVKVKLGRASPLQEARQLNLLFSDSPWVKIRADVNQTWTLAAAQTFFSALSKDVNKQFDFFEEPCQTPALSLLMAQQWRVKLAWDESLRGGLTVLDTLKSTLVSSHIKALVIKPTLEGSLSRLAKWASIAKKHQLELIISSSLESSFGLGELAKLAAQVAPDVAAGLDTDSLFTHNLIRPFSEANRPLIGLEQCESICVLTG